MKNKLYFTRPKGYFTGCCMWALLSLFLCHTSMAQEVETVKVESVVQNEMGDPITGATIYGNNGQTVTYTDDAGKFTIEVPTESKLDIEADGYQKLTIYAGIMVQGIVLKANTDTGDYMVNLPFQQVNRKDLGGAVGVINPRDFLEIDYNFNAIGGLAGRSPGVLWNNNIWGMGEALVMIDGIPRELVDVTLNEIEQITVLKGVNAVALYGSQAAKGVILITTKRGTPHQKNINVRVNSGIAQPVAMPSFLGASEYMTLFNEARRNDGLPEMFSEELIANHGFGNFYQYPDVDYFSSAYLRPFHFTHDANAEFSGGNEQARFYTNIGWQNGGTLLNIGEGANESDNRFNIRGNVDVKLNDFISTTVDISAVLNNSHRGHGDYWNSAATQLPHRFSPLIPLDMLEPDNEELMALANNSRNIIDGLYLLGGAQDLLTNPFADLYAGGYNQLISRRMQITNGIKVDLDRAIKGLEFQTNFNLDYFNAYNQAIDNSYGIYVPAWSTTDEGDIITGLQRFGNDARPGVQNINASAQRQNMGLYPQLSYRTTVQDNHHISARLLGTANRVTINDEYQPLTNTSLGLHLGYHFQDKYYVDFSGNYANSARLPEGNRTAFSPTVGLGWLLSSEGFLSSSEKVDHLKLTASGGIIHTDLDIDGYYLYNNIYSRQAFYSWRDDIHNNQATTSLQGANPNFSFVQRQELNVGLEGAFFNRLLWVEGTFFVNRMDGLPTQLNAVYPNYFYHFAPYNNYNIDQRSGMDLLVNLNKNIGEFNINLGMNATYVDSRVIRRDEIFQYDYQNRTGKPVDAIFGLANSGFYTDVNNIENHAIPVFGEVRPGDIRYVDQNGDGIIDERDEVMIGRWTPPFHFALNLSVSYKNFDLFVQGTGHVGGNGITNDDYFWVDGNKKYSELVRDRWTEETMHTATYPRLSAVQNPNNHRTSDFWMYNTDRFNLSKVQLTYHLPQGLLGEGTLRDMIVYVNGANLYTFSKNRDILDLNIGGVPQMRFFNLGLRGSF